MNITINNCQHITIQEHRQNENRAGLSNRALSFVSMLRSGLDHDRKQLEEQSQEIAQKLHKWYLSLILKGQDSVGQETV